MPRIMEKVTPVKITADEINCYATVQRSCISAVTACLRVKDMEHVNEFMKLKHWAEKMYDGKVKQQLAESKALNKDDGEEGHK